MTTETAPETLTVIVERTLSHPPEKVWRAITETDLIARWLMRNDFVPDEGHRFQFRDEPSPYWSGIVDSEVRAVEPGKRLVYTWVSDGVNSVVEFTLVACASGTVLRMEHSGFRKNQCGAFRGAQSGWQRFFGELEKVLATME